MDLSNDDISYDDISYDDTDDDNIPDNISYDDIDDSELPYSAKIELCITLIDRLDNLFLDLINKSNTISLDMQLRLFKQEYRIYGQHIAMLDKLSNTFKNK